METQVLLPPLPLQPELKVLYSKLFAIHKIADAIQKDKKGFNYTYTSLVSILARITAGMNKHNLLLVPRFVPGTTEVNPYSYTKLRLLKDGKTIEEPVNEVMVEATIVYTWVDLDSMTTLDIPWFIVGSQTDPSQALGTAMTYGLRYFLQNFFQIATLDDSMDPDNFRSRQKEAAELEAAIANKEIIDKLDKDLRAFLDSLKGKAKEAAGKEVKEMVTRYTKDGNYFSIKDPAASAALYAELSEKFFTEKERD